MLLDMAGQISPNSTAHSADGGSGNGDSIDLLQYGWASQPNNRGTVDILWSCLFTVFLCTWVMLCLNLPSPHESYWSTFLRKLRWMVLAIMGPEFVLTFAYGQWAAAKASVKDFAALSQPDWSLRHAFFANMGGFVLQPRESRPFPINAKQLHWLVAQKYLPYPAIDKRVIWDKSKANGFAKIITLTQTLWFILQCLGRAPQRLSITTLELSSVAIVVCTLATAFCWLHKPVDIETPIILTTDATIEQILCQAGDAAEKPFRETPLDFIDNQGPSWSTDVMAKFRIPTGPRERPLQRLANDRIPQRMGVINVIVLCILTLLYASIHLTGWNFHFPSHAEMILWRVCSAILFGTTTVFWFVDRAMAWRRYGFWQYWFNLVFHPGKAEILAAHAREHPPPPFRLSWVECVLCTILGVNYTAARLYLIIEVFLGLRVVPKSTYTVVQWTSFLPHV
jgi:hypothetical protein